MKYIVTLIISTSLSSCIFKAKETINTVEFKNEIIESSYDIEKIINSFMDSIELYENKKINYIPHFFSNKNLDSDLFYGGLQHAEVSYRVKFINSITNKKLLLELSENTIYSMLPDTSGRYVEFMPSWDVSNSELARLRYEFLYK